MAPIIGTSGGQDAKRRAALDYYNQLGGQGGGGAPSPSAAPTMGADPAMGGGGGTVADLLMKAAHQTVKQPENIQANMAAWKSVALWLQENLKAVQQGAGPEAPSTPQPSAMGQMGAQAAAPAFGRPPR